MIHDILIYAMEKKGNKYIYIYTFKKTCLETMFWIADFHVQVYSIQEWLDINGQLLTVIIHLILSYFNHLT